MTPGQRLLVVDAANVVGSRPDGWWRDRAGAARRLVERIVHAVHDGRVDPPVVVVLEGQARHGVDEGPAADGVDVVHARRDGDDAVVAVVADRDGARVVVTADRALTARVTGDGAQVVRPSWLLDRL